jgi:nucleoside-diphosphate-sugar epimerase
VRVLVTGGRGFLGGHVVGAFRAAGHEAVPLGRSDGDLAEPGVARRLLGEHRPDVVVHLAASVGRVAAERDPVESIRQNAGVSALVARACACGDVPLVHGSTTEVYAPATVYALSKRWSEDIVLHYRPDAALLRFSWPYGPGVLPGQGRGAIPNMLDQALRGQPIVVHRGSARSWCWAGDAARAVVAVAVDGRGGPWDVGRDDDPVPMLELARLVCRLTGAPEGLIEEVEAPPGGVSQALDTERLRDLGWRPEVDLEQGLRATLDWLRSAGPTLRSGAA